VIEDDDDARANLRDILELDDYGVDTAGSAAEALNQDDWSKFFAIILDRRLPDATANELLPQLKRLAPEAAVIIVTGYADLEGAIAALRQGAADYILKPLNPEALRASLARVAERRHLALAKERSEAAFRHLVEAAECMIVILRTDRSIAYFSPFAERLTGYSASEVHGLDYLLLFVPDEYRTAAADEIERVLAGHATQGFENPVVCRDKSLRWMVWNARQLPDYDEGSAILVVGQDITNLMEAQERALNAERLAAIGHMVAGLAHESRNAFQRSQACLEMLTLHVQDRPEALDFIARIQKALDHLHHLYEDVRGYAAPIKLERHACDLSEVWQEAWALLEPLRREKRASLRAEVDGHNLQCTVDPFRMGQVFRNIFDNALAAAGHPAAIEIHTSLVQLDRHPALRIAVRDNGPGLNSEQQQRIFDPFYTTKTKGTGLGMAIVKRIVEAHGGLIAAGTRAPQAGTEIVITLPRD